MILNNLNFKIQITLMDLQCSWIRLICPVSLIMDWPNMYIDFVKHLLNYMDAYQLIVGKKCNNGGENVRMADLLSVNLGCWQSPRQGSSNSAFGPWKHESICMELIGDKNLHIWRDLQIPERKCQEARKKKTKMVDRD